MATNGESATNWLKEHGETTAPERLRKIRNSIASQLEENSPDDQQHIELLEALDVMDDYLINNNAAVVNNRESASLTDLLPLCDNTTAPSPRLTEDEKKQRFKTLLNTGKLPSIIS
ncbi:MAG: hypothetical protein KAG53_09195 [Endozoicomonadaceae bacterium]|nr:hypothetical protein [Endozoicomonadaceae bacterium]